MMTVQAILSVATLKQKLWIKLAISLNHIILTSPLTSPWLIDFLKICLLFNRCYQPTRCLGQSSVKESWLSGVVNYRKQVYSQLWTLQLNINVWLTFMFGQDYRGKKNMYGLIS